MKKNYYCYYIFRKTDFVRWQNILFFLMLISFLFLSGKVFAQSERIEGSVHDASSNEPLIGVSVMIKGSASGTMTDVEGRFSVNASSESTLVFSYVGYLTQEIKIGNQRNIRVSLKEDSKLLDEVVVVGFGTQRKVNVTGSIGVATAKDIESRPVANAVQALQGVVPGLQITQSSGSLDKNPSINVRGTGTIGDSKDSPLVLIDGMEGDLNTINPQDIENISVLKDAAASSIYGSRAPFGVILVTTKKGKAGRTSVNYNNNFRWGAPTVKMQMVDSYTFANYYNQSNRNSSNSTANFFSDQTVQNILDYKNGLIEGPLPIPTGSTQWRDVMTTAYADVDWYDVFYKDYNFSQEHNFSANGGSEKMTYYFSANYMNQQGLLKIAEEDIKRYNISGKIDAQLTDWANIAYSTRFIRTDYSKPSAMNDGLYENLARQNWPNTPLYDNNGYLLGGRPGRDFIQGGTYNQVKDINYHQFTLKLEPVKNWVTIADLNYRTNSEDVKAIYLRTYDHDINGEPVDLLNQGNSVSQSRYKSNYLNANFRTNYSLTVANVHNFHGMAGIQIEDFFQSSYGLRAYGLVFEGLPVVDLTTNMNGYTETQPSVSGNEASWATAGFFGRLNYDYDERYLFEANLRYDGSSRFRNDKRWTLLPSFSAGWNMAHESFWKPIEHIVGYAKLRASYGELGNTNTNSWYPTYLTMNVNPNSGLWIQDLTGTVRPTTTNTPNPVSTTLTWETIRTVNFGLDWGLLNNRLMGSFDIYTRYTENMLGGGAELPSIFGATVPAVNELNLQTSGWELELEWKDQLKNGFSYSAKVTVSDAQTEVTKFPSNPTNSLSNYIAGQMTGNIWGYTTVGIAQSDEQMRTHLEQLDANYEAANGQAPATLLAGQNGFGTGWAAGDIMYTDLNGDGKINSGNYSLDDSGDMTLIGNNTPRFQFGIDLNAAYKGFDLRVFFQGVMKRDYWQGSSYFWGANTDAYWSTALTQHMDFYLDENSYLVQEGIMEANQDAYYPRPSFDSGGKFGRNHQTQTRYLQNAAYIRLKNLQIGYTLPANLTKKAQIERVRIYFSGENLWTGTKLAKMFDPETVSGGNYNTNADWRTWNNGNAYPLSRTFSCGLSLSL